MGHRIYLAGRYSRKEFFAGLAADLSERGHIITAQWLTEPHGPEATLDSISQADLIKYANIDITEIRHCDTFLFMSEDPLKGTPRGGRHVEFGYALALGKRIVVYGPKENIFHYLPNEVVHFDTWFGVVDYLHEVKRHVTSRR